VKEKWQKLFVYACVSFGHATCNLVSFIVVFVVVVASCRHLSKVLNEMKEADKVQ